MERRSGTNTAVVTAEQVKVAMGKVRTLEADEEKVLRMRHGATTDRNAPLPLAAGDNAELGDELALIELQLFKAYRMLRAQTAARVQVPGIVRTPARSQAKDRIIRSLRKKR